MRKKLKTDGVDGLLEIVKAIQQGEDPEEMLKRKEAQRLEAEREAQKLAREQEEAERAAREEAEQAAREEAERAAQEKAERAAQKEAKRAAKKEARLAAKKEAKRAAKKEAEQTAKKEAEQTAQKETEQVTQEEIERDPSNEEVFDYELSEDEKIFERLLKRNGISKEEIRAEQEAAAKEAAAKEAAVLQEQTDPETEHTEKGARLTFSDIRGYALGVLDDLKQRGISRKELLMLLTGLLLAIFVLAAVSNGISALLEQRQKKEHVTADQGLTVTVEKEPEEWCALYPVELKFKASDGAVKQVTINSENYLPEENGIITVETGEWLLEATVTLENGTQLAARIEIPMLDAQAPAVTAEQSENTIVLTAADARSEIKHIYYAAVSSYTPWEIPVYQIYKEPLNYTADTLYYFYAEDIAGNRSVPIMTTMETAETTELTLTEAELFPGETKKLQVVTTPEYALLSSVRYESTDASVVQVDSTGVMTAVGEGIASVKVSVQGTGEADETSMTCTVTVSRSRSVTISAIGDCTLGTDASFDPMTNFNAFETVNGKAYFFKNVKEILAEDDLTFANLEGTFTTETTREVKEFAFKGDPSYTEILQEGSVEVVTLANNHSSDYGAQSLEDTKQYLTEAGIDYCIGDTIAMKEVNGIKTAFIGIYVLNDGMGRETQVRETIAQAKAQGAQLIITAFHWGSEKATEPDDTQTALAHLAVECGANLVLGHHPHVLQGIEKYNGVYIVYSLGNFCFGGNSTPSDKDTMIFQQTFMIVDGEVQDDDQIRIIPCSISSTSNYNNYQPTPAEGTEADRIMEKINGYSAVYGQSFTADTGI